MSLPGTRAKRTKNQNAVIEKTTGDGRGKRVREKKEARNLCFS